MKAFYSALLFLCFVCLFVAMPSPSFASSTNLPSPSAIALMVDTNWAIVSPTNAVALAAAFRAANGIPGTNDTATLSNRVDEIELDLPAITTRLDDIEGDLPAITTRLDDIEGDLPAITTRLDDIEGDLPAITTRLDDIEGDLPAITTRLDDIGGDLPAITNRLDGLEAGTVALTSMVTAISGTTGTATWADGQYPKAVLTDGTRPLAGDLNANTNDFTNVASVFLLGPGLLVTNAAGSTANPDVTGYYAMTGQQDGTNTYTQVGGAGATLSQGGQGQGRTWVIDTGNPYWLSADDLFTDVPPLGQFAATSECTGDVYVVVSSNYLLTAQAMYNLKGDIAAAAGVFPAASNVFAAWLEARWDADDAAVDGNNLDLDGSDLMTGDLNANTNDLTNVASVYLLGCAGLLVTNAAGTTANPDVTGYYAMTGQTDGTNTYTQVGGAGATLSQGGEGQGRTWVISPSGPYWLSDNDVFTTIPPLGLFRATSECTGDVYVVASSNYLLTVKTIYDLLAADEDIDDDNLSLDGSDTMTGDIPMSDSNSIKNCQSVELVDPAYIGVGSSDASTTGGTIFQPDSGLYPVTGGNPNNSSGAWHTARSPVMYVYYSGNGYWCIAAAIEATPGAYMIGGASAGPTGTYTWGSAEYTGSVVIAASAIGDQCIEASDARRAQHAVTNRQDDVMLGDFEARSSSSNTVGLTVGGGVMQADQKQLIVTNSAGEVFSVDKDGDITARGGELTMNSEGYSCDSAANAYFMLDRSSAQYRNAHVQYLTAGTPYWSVGLLNGGTGNDHNYYILDGSGAKALTIENVSNDMGIKTNAPDTTLDLNGVLTLRQSTQPLDPDNGASQVWMSDGAGAGDAGDIMVIIHSGGTIKTNKLIDFSAL